MRSRRVLQVGYLVTAVALVVVADLVADRLATVSPSGPAVPFVALGGRVLGGLSVGMAFRLQQRRRMRPDPSLRLLVGLPSAVLAATPILLASWPAAGAAGPSSLIVGLQRLAPFAAAVLGLTFALALRASRQ